LPGIRRAFFVDPLMMAAQAATVEATAPSAVREKLQCPRSSRLLLLLTVLQAHWLSIAFVFATHPVEKAVLTWPSRRRCQQHCANKCP
jgi:hypothetical protein